MDYSCGNCIDIWVCSWCKNKYCDDTMCLYRLEGKPKYWNIYEIIYNNKWAKKQWLSLSEKEQNKRKAQLSTKPPVMQNFFLCQECKNTYNNICKEKHSHKIAKNKNKYC